MATLTERRCKPKTKNLQTPAKRRMKAFSESRRKPFDRLASSFSLTEKSAVMATVMDRRYNNRDEHSQIGILTSASNRLPAFPSRTAEQWPWEFVSRYSGATVPDFHRVP
jgi:hypothetical protein